MKQKQKVFFFQASCSSKISDVILLASCFLCICPFFMYIRSTLSLVIFSYLCVFFFIYLIAEEISVCFSQSLFEQIPQAKSGSWINACAPTHHLTIITSQRIPSPIVIHHNHKITIPKFIARKSPFVCSMNRMNKLYRRENKHSQRGVSFVLVGTKFEKLLLLLDAILVVVVVIMPDIPPSIVLCVGTHHQTFFLW